MAEGAACEHNGDLSNMEIEVNWPLLQAGGWHSSEAQPHHLSHLLVGRFLVYSLCVRPECAVCICGGFDLSN